jgi:hypothetical protein
MTTHRENNDRRFTLQRQVITWMLIAGGTFLVANAWLIVQMLGPIG